MNYISGNRFPLKAGALAVLLAISLSGCAELSADAAGVEPGDRQQAGSTTIEKDVERPDVFSVTENALWDGRPSLGGVWVAYPANVDPERVVIRNGANGKSVIGALFRRERENPGPKIQLSSDAATALGVIAGSPAEITIIALRREEVEIVVEPAEVPIADATETTPHDTAENVSIPLRRGASTGGAAVAAIVEQTLADTPAAASDDTPAIAPEAPVSRLRKPYIQVASFAEEPRAQELISVLEGSGIQGHIRLDESGETPLYRVISGPIMTRKERSGQLRIIKGLGFDDAFYSR
ncbi:MAG: SPOR domain-containing protein [Rhodobacteraceae bacterium]|nr:SPOR domain-containing protein [Paracoccaceae bacterium]